MKRESLPDGTVIYGGGGGAAVMMRLAPGVVLLTAHGTFEVSTSEGPMKDFDEELSRHGKLVLCLDMSNRKSVAKSSRDDWIAWARRNRQKLHVLLLVQSKLVDMAISVMAMLAGGMPLQSFSDVRAFERAIAREIPGFQRIPAIPPRATTIANEA
jgi:hypothetical protein